MPVCTDVTTELAEVLDRLAELDPTALADRDAIISLHRELERLKAITIRAVAAFDARRDWSTDGAYNAAAWLATRCHLPMPTAHREVRVGRQLRDAPLVEEAFLAGEIGDHQAGQLARLRTPFTAEAFDRDQALLVSKAKQLRFSWFCKAVSYWRYLADRDRSEADAQAQYDGREFHHSQSFEGRWFTKGTFDPIGGSIFDNELRRIEDELFEEDWAEARSRGDEYDVAPLRRTAAQRRADAAVEMARRSAAVAPGSRLPEPLFSVLVGYETFAGPICELANGATVTPGSLVPWLSEAMIERVVFDGPSRVIDVGVKRRLFAGATRRAVEIRDQECFHEFCEQRADACEIDHIEPHAAGGDTVQANGRVACDFHNRQRHRRRPPPVP